MVKIKLISLVAIMMSLSLLSTNSAFAGYSFSYPVTITPTYFKGSFGSARNLAGGQYLGCLNSAGYVRCFARNNANKYISCTSNNPNNIAVARSLADSGYVKIFYTGGTCTKIEAANGSYQRPK